ncbi:hypothetical protein [Endozoicomonas sp. SCSIO W0465]|uniref:hypothetical protein n=1 Tax=Endozoicomonas sp. SCSIO W0465 TaxID=2918516 RepID=UPI0020762722|nr:hypothetical protein [Endozoicomonas sp. SCSIO W0465]USE35442.1 hypothetical protein MJO57_25625 [Endozoicomonas sp. SCSIO W0465]
MLANIVEKWCLRGWYKNQKIPDLCGGAEQLPSIYSPAAVPRMPEQAPGYSPYQNPAPHICQKLPVNANRFSISSRKVVRFIELLFFFSVLSVLLIY